MEQTAIMLASQPGQLDQVARQVAAAVKEIIEATAIEISTREGKRKYVRVEGYQAIANGFGCVGSARDVKQVFDETTGEFKGYRAIGEVKRTSDGAVIATAEGFIGTDEPRWFGGKSSVWDKEKRKEVEKVWKPAPEYSIRAMCQTRAVARALRAAFAFVVVMVNKKISTTPAEDVEPGDEPHGREVHGSGEKPAKGRVTGAPEQDEKASGRWEDVVCSYGQKNGPLRGKPLGELTVGQRKYLRDKFLAEGVDFNALSEPDKKMVAGLRQWIDETGEQS